MCEHHHEHGSGHHKTAPLVRISIALAVFAAGMLFHLPAGAEFVVFLVAYLAAGGDVLLAAFKNIVKGHVFDENFLMGIATLGAFAIKEYPEAVMVMILYQIGEFL